MTSSTVLSPAYGTACRSLLYLFALSLNHIVLHVPWTRLRTLHGHPRRRTLNLNFLLATILADSLHDLYAEKRGDLIVCGRLGHQFTHKDLVKFRVEFSVLALPGSKSPHELKSIEDVRKDITETTDLLRDESFYRFTTDTSEKDCVGAIYLAWIEILRTYFYCYISLYHALNARFSSAAGGLSRILHEFVFGVARDLYSGRQQVLDYVEAFTIPATTLPIDRIPPFWDSARIRSREVSAPGNLCGASFRTRMRGTPATGPPGMS